MTFKAYSCHLFSHFFTPLVVCVCGGGGGGGGGGYSIEEVRGYGIRLVVNGIVPCFPEYFTLSPSL